MELAHANRVAAMGQLTASIVHEVNQPITATTTNAQAALRFLDAQVVDLNEVRQIFNDIVKDGNRAGEVISRIRDFIKKAPPRREGCEISGAIREVIELSHESSSHVISDLYRSPILDLRALDAEEPRYAWTGRSCQAISHHGGRAKRNVKGGTAATLWCRRERYCASDGSFGRKF
jgi:C4-dicarboxylate-specific signal transduction histidine kinase